MALKNRQGSASNDGEGCTPPERSADELDLARDGILEHVRRSLSGGLIWLVLILVGAGLAITHFALVGSLRSATEPGENDARPFFRDGHVYSSRYITAVKKAELERRDLLADYDAFRSVWDEVSPDAPMMLKVVRAKRSGADPRPYLGPSRRRAVPVDSDSFREQRPLLDQIRTLILKGDGTGRGKLDSSGYEAEPADLTPDLPPAHHDPQ